MGTIVIICLIVIAGGLAYTYFKQDKSKAPSTGAPYYPPEYAQFLSEMETVFKGAHTKAAQAKYLKQRKASIEKWERNQDFKKKFDSIIRRYGK